MAPSAPRKPAPKREAPKVQTPLQRISDKYQQQRATLRQKEQAEKQRVRDRMQQKKK